jgi:transposase
MVGELKVSCMESEPKNKRRHYSAAERERLLAAWSESGESAAVFGARHGVHASNLFRWARTAGGTWPGGRPQRSAKAGFVELKAAPPRIAMARSQDEVHFEIECPKGLKLRASGHVDVDVLAQLAAALTGARPC